MPPDAFPWRQAMAFGLGVLKLSSAEFWAMTPRELVAALDGILGRFSTPLDRTRFEALAARYPDRRHHG